ncbi:MAG: hypothetical protein VX496_08995 [Planctomycetota bacterium]|nr:hypothetical protein [Planctomycetota bacterium]
MSFQQARGRTAHWHRTLASGILLALIALSSSQARCQETRPGEKEQPRK